MNATSDDAINDAVDRRNAVPPDAAGGAVRFGVLGPLLVVDAMGAAWPVPAAKLRIVLATLLLAAGRAVAAADLAEALWDASPPPNTPAVMRTYVARLRRALGPAGARLSGRPAGWAVELRDPEEFDLTEVDYRWRTARAAIAAQNWQQVSSLLAGALGLWRGEPLADVPSALLARRELEGLAELRLRLTEARIDADLHIGRHNELVAELRRLTAGHPLRERFHAQLMLACYRCGHQAAALEVYRDARKTLADELGIEPGHELQKMHQKILTGDPCLTTAAPAPVKPAPFVRGLAEPGALTSLLDGAADVGGTAVALPARARQRRPEGSRARFAARSIRSAGDGSSPKDPVPVGAVNVVRFKRLCQLPADIPDFAGRLAECSRLAGLLAVAEGATAVPVAVVSGLPGVGKTSLAVHVAHAVRARFPDGQLYVQLAGASAPPRAPGEVLGELLRAVGVAAGSIPAEAEARAAVLRTCLADRRVLLLADDAASAAQVRMLVPGTAGCAVLVTSRDRLAGLTAAHLHLESLQPADAVDMLGRIAGEQRIAADPPAAAALVAGCRHLPLAVRIAGARLAARPSWLVATLATLVAGRRDQLNALTMGDLAVRTALELSYQALPPRARTGFRLLALTGPFDVAGTGWVHEMALPLMTHT